VTSPLVPPHAGPAAVPPTGSRRWWILAVLCTSVFVVVMDGTIVNVALPTFAIELGASTSQLQWIVDAYLLVFTGLLLAAGTLGDRYGRRGMLAAGLVVFAMTSAWAAVVDTPQALIYVRGAMGIGAAMVFPATLALLTNVFIDPRERAIAIGMWSGVSGVAVAAGPILGGWLLEDYWWGSVFLINLPIVVVVLAGIVLVVPESRHLDAPRLDVGGVVLSIAAVGVLILTVIEAPVWGWTSGRTAIGLAGTVVLLTAFVRWELRAAHPMLPVRIFRNMRFTAASVAVTSAFFGLFGFIFLITQYFQLIRGYSPLEAGVRTLPVALSIALAAVLAPRIVERIGTTVVVASGLGLMTAGFLWVSTASAVTPYGEIVGQMILLGLGLGLTTAPATESIMGSLSRDMAGVGSAVNDTTRELGGTLGVAIVGSTFNSTYIGALADSAVVASLPAQAQAVTRESIAAAGTVAAQLGDAAPAYLTEVGDAFLAGLGIACLVVAGATAAGAIVVARFLPARAAADPDFDGRVEAGGDAAAELLA
jgi:EmrB/QacA subfamily drug resistance transporter